MTDDEKAKQFLRYAYWYIWEQLKKENVKKIDSNYFHFVIAHVISKFPELQKIIPVAMYYHGTYIPMLDDLLVEEFGMELKYHQLKGEEPYMHEWCETEYEVMKNE